MASRMPMSPEFRAEQPEDDGLMGAVAPVLPSERLPQGFALPRVLRAQDLTVLCLIAVFLVANVSTIASGGGAAFLYLGLGFVAFLIPSALICAQLYRLFPAEGAVYLWTHKALGSFWDMFVGFFCHWWPGAFGLTIEVGAAVTYLQAMNPTWLQQPWQQGLTEIGVLLLALAMCSLGQRSIQMILNTVFLGYAAIIVLLGLAGGLWLLSGHLPQGDFTSQGWQISKANLPLFAIVILSLLGMEVPLNMGGELANRREGRRYLSWATIITIVGYLIATFGILVVLPPDEAEQSGLISTVFTQAFGSTAGTAFGAFTNVTLVIYFICATAAFNLMFARLLMVTSVDWRLPRSLHRLNARGVPFTAMTFQVGFNIIFIAILFFLAPTLAPTNPLESLLVFLVTINGLGVVWELSMVALFITGIVLFARYRRELANRWIAPPLILYLAAILGMVSAGISIFTIFYAGSPIPFLLDNSQWIYYVALVVLGSLALGAVLSFLAPEAEDTVELTTRLERRPGQRMT
ncbi:MAG TPA: APC family permease [Ktedonobacterales bacterium]|jgi:amino acid transporter